MTLAGLIIAIFLFIMKNFDELEKLIRFLKKMKVCIAESLTGGKLLIHLLKKKVHQKFLIFQLFVIVMILSVTF